jgi:hypothetical protein
MYQYDITKVLYTDGRELRNMSTKIWPLCLATVILIASVCLAAGSAVSQNVGQSAQGSGITQTGSNSADVGGWGNNVNQGVDQDAFGSGISQTGSNSADVGGWGNNVDQNIDQNAQGSGITQTGSNVANVNQPSYIPPTSSGGTSVNLPQGEVSYYVIPNAGSFQPTYGLEMRVMYNGLWTAGPASVCLGRSMSAVIRNDQNQYLRTYEKYPSGYLSVKDWGYHLGGTYLHGVFVGDTLGWHQLRARGSRSGWGSIIWIYVAKCGGWYPPSGGWNPSGGGNWVNQGVDQNAQGTGITQTGSNSANVGGWGNNVDQNIDQNAQGTGITQTGSNSANVGGWGNNVDQTINQNAHGNDISQNANNVANMNGQNNALNQQINQNAEGSGISQSGSNRASVTGGLNDIHQGVSQGGNDLLGAQLSGGSSGHGEFSTFSNPEGSGTDTRISVG